jgi:aminodeoxyfutalosine synthase
MNAIAEQLRRSGLEDILGKIHDGRRLGHDDGMRLYTTPDLTTVGYLANLARERRSGDRTYFVRNLHINYTNVCNKLCKFCSFYAAPNSQDGRGYVLSPEEAAARVAQYAGEPIREIHMVAGINPKLSYDYYLDLLRSVKAARPDAQIKAFTMIELAQIARVARRPLADILPELQAAGLAACPGGGAEVFSDRVHEECSGPSWITKVVRGGPRAPRGIRSNVTMLYGHIDSGGKGPASPHVRELRMRPADSCASCRWLSIPAEPSWRISRSPRVRQSAEIAVGRLLLDNVEHVKAFWIMITPGVAQMALWYGADDLDGTVSQYEITHALGTRSHRQVLTVEQLLDLSLEVGRVPIERDALYNVIEQPSAFSTSISRLP